MCGVLIVLTIHNCSWLLSPAGTRSPWPGCGSGSCVCRGRWWWCGRPSPWLTLSTLFVFQNLRAGNKKNLVSIFLKEDVWKIWGGVIQIMSACLKTRELNSDAHVWETEKNQFQFYHLEINKCGQVSMTCTFVRFVIQYGLMDTLSWKNN